MKVCILILIIMLTESIYSQKENFIAIYKIDYIPYNYDSILNSKKDENKELQKMLKNHFEKLKFSFKQLHKINFILKYNKNESLYYKEKSILLDENSMKSVYPILSIKDSRYYTYNDKIYSNINAFGQDFNLEFDKVKWEITNESKKIGAYNCYKAIGTLKKNKYLNKKDKKITAWFSPDIPFNFGPKYYNGLPGLIIRLEERKNLIYYLFSLKKINNSKIKFTKKGKSIKIDELKNIAKNMNENRRNQ